MVVVFGKGNIFLNMTKPEAILEAVRVTDVGSDIILHNNDGAIWCILKVKCKEHNEEKDEDGGQII